VVDRRHWLVVTPDQDAQSPDGFCRLHIRSAVSHDRCGAELEAQPLRRLLEQQGSRLAAWTAALVGTMEDRVEASACLDHLGAHPSVDLFKLSLRHMPAGNPPLVGHHHKRYIESGELSEALEGPRRKRELCP
jgi:hypothetical protein